MKSPSELSSKLTHQWQNPRLRSQRLLTPQAWPIELPIGPISAEQFARHPEQIRKHLQAWRAITVGEIVWAERKYRDAEEPVAIPRTWRLHKPGDWIQACNDTSVANDYSLLSRLITQLDSQFHDLLIRQLPRLRNIPESEIMQSVRIALQLQPGIAQGKPLRALSMGADSKFFERNRRLLTQLLDQRFGSEASAQGLETFLGAISERDHWLLLRPLQVGLLPFEQQRIRATELQRTALPASHILVVENEQCLHQLPPIDDCIAILGAGLNLGWMQAPWLTKRRLAYWGDLDSWGLAMLGQARKHQPHVQPLMMTRSIFDRYAASAVAEPVSFHDAQPAGLSASELQLFQHLLTCQKGRLEQEFLPVDRVAEVVRDWAN